MLNFFSKRNLVIFTSTSYLYIYEFRKFQGINAIVQNDIEMDIAVIGNNYESNGNFY